MSPEVMTARHVSLASDVYRQAQRKHEGEVCVWEGAVERRKQILTAPPSPPFSFAILAAELLTGAKPFAGRTVGAIVHAVVISRERPPLPSSSAPAPLLALVHAAWAHAPDDRPTFPAILAALRAWCEGEWEAGEAAWCRGRTSGDSGGGDRDDGHHRVVPALVVEAARVASGSAGSGRAAVAVSPKVGGGAGPPARR
jgi:hypothetical protein